MRQRRRLKQEPQQRVSSKHRLTWTTSISCPNCKTWSRNMKSSWKRWQCRWTLSLPECRKSVNKRSKKPNKIATSIVYKTHPMMKIELDFCCALAPLLCRSRTYKGKIKSFRMKKKKLWRTRTV